MIVATGQGSRIPIDRAVAVLDPRRFELIILPTEQCNFRCTYCYEDFEIGAMKAPVVEGIKRLLRSRAEDIDVLTISWFGGEPLLATRIVLDVSTFAHGLMNARGKVFTSGITTNGYKLTPSLFDALLDAGVTQYQISLDGPAELHDKTRRRADGEGTFAKIWANLVAIAAKGERDKSTAFHVLLRVHYDSQTAYQLEPLLAAIHSQLAPSNRFTLLMHEIERLGGQNDDAIAVPTAADHAHVRTLLEKYGGHGSPGKAHTLAADVQGYVCYAARANSLLVRADGRLGKCTVALNDDRNVVGRLHPDGTVEVSNERMAPWLRGLFSGDADVLACPRSGMPVGDTQLVQFRKRDSIG